MSDRCKQSSVTICHLFGTRFDLYFNESAILFFDNTVNTVVIHQWQINIQSFHEHFSNNSIFHTLAKTSRVSERNSHRFSPNSYLLFNITQNSRE